MTLPVPSQTTANVGDFIPAALWNADVRDAVNFLLNKPLCVVYQSTGQSIANGAGATVPVAFDTSVVDSYSGHSTVTNNSRYIAQVAGWYLVYGSISFSSNTSGGRSVEIYVNGGALAYTRVDFSPGANAAGSALSTSGRVYLNAGDYVEIRCGQTSGAALSLNGGSSQMHLAWDHQ